MLCPACGHENRESASFCEQCGTALAKVCKNCGERLRPSARFCDNCGQAVDGATPAQAPASERRVPETLAERMRREGAGIEGERRTVTVLFIDAADSTAMGSRFDPEVLHAAVRDCTKLMVDAVHKYEGFVSKFRGDGIMAIFGAPLAHEDAARRAVAAAIEMRDALVRAAADFARAGRPSFRYRLGLHTDP